jgi:hypothetical protein
MRKLWLGLVLVVSGCAGAPFALQAPASASMAHLAVRERPDYPFQAGLDGFISVSGREVPGGPVRELWVASGRREIAYSCPGWVTVDGPASMVYEFAAGGRYELTCQSPPAIEVVR